MLMHHGGRNYDEAVGAAAARARAVIEEQIERGRASASTVIDRVMREVPTDYVARAQALGFRETEIEAEPVSVVLDGRAFGLARHALGQAVQSIGMPISYAQSLSEQPWGRALLAYDLAEHFSHDEGKRLLRTYNGRLRGIMSDRYRRIDSRPCVEAVCEAAKDIGLVPISGVASETRVALRAMLPRVFEPYAGEVLAYGLTWENSDYGNGKHRLSVFVFRCWCTNLAMGDELLSEVHLGKRLDDRIEYSERTYQLDTEASVSALRDTIHHALAPQTVEHMNGIIAAAAKAVLVPGALKERLDGFKKVLTRDEIARVADVYNSPDVEMLPPGNTVWRLSNALSWVAGQTEDAERQLEIQKLAARPLPALLPAAA